VGGQPLTALNLVGFPSCSLGTGVLVAILRGGAEKVAEAGAVIVGGHTVEDEEPKYGLAVTGTVDPRRMTTAMGCRPGDRLVLTKPLGTGILATALKGEVLGEADIAEAISGMAALNRKASEIMIEVGVSACTDVTGFGLLGHGLEMAAASGVALELEGCALPAYPHTLEMAAIGLVPEGSYNNRAYYLPKLENADQLPTDILDLIADPQTSGGLLIAVPAEKCEELRRRVREAGVGDYLVGKAVEGPPGRLRVV
jgi:selenide,water dikinase